MRTKAEEQLELLLHLTLAPERDNRARGSEHLEQNSYRELAVLAEAHHVTVRALTPLYESATAAGCTEAAAFLEASLQAEQDRIAEVLPALDRVCQAFAGRGHDLVVIKSLDHWPDFGDDADFYTEAGNKLVDMVFVDQFRAARKPRTLGDRLAGKKTFILPGVKTHFEAHVKRLGQVGEQVQVAHRFLWRARIARVQGYEFLIPAAEERILIAALMRMYRHLHIRICDVLNTGALIRREEIDFDELQKVAESAGIWAGLATYLSIVSEFYSRYAGSSLNLPSDVQKSAVFNLGRLSMRGTSMSIPMIPEASRLFRRQWLETVRHGSLGASLRLMTVPPLVTASTAANALFGRGLRIW